MFSALGETAFALLFIHTLVAALQAWWSAPAFFRAGLAHPKTRKVYENLQRTGRTGAMLWKMTRTNFMFRHWLLSDLHVFFAGAGAQASALRSTSLVYGLAVMLVARAAGSTGWEAAGIGAFEGMVLFTLGAVGIYSGRLAATAGDKRILGLT